jgi:curved DNA-binding protein CbpA
MEDTLEKVIDSSSPTPDSIKAFGNNYFSRGAYQQAIDSYTEAIELLEKQNDTELHSNQKQSVTSTTLLSQLYSNRAAAYLERNSNQFDIITALSDSNTAIRLSETFVRAYQRKGAAQLALQPAQTNEAISTLQRGLMHALDAETAVTDIQSKAAATAIVTSIRNSIALAQLQLSKERDVETLKTTKQNDKPTNSNSTNDINTSTLQISSFDDPMLAFFSEIGTLQSEQEEKEKERVRVAAEAAASIALNAKQGLASLINGDSSGSLMGSTTLIKTMFSNTILDEDNNSEEEEKRLEALRLVSSGKEYELIGPAATRQSLEITNASLGTAYDQTERLLGPHQQWLRLNPFEVLLLPYTSSDEDIKNRFRKLSTMIHPDKNDHPRAGDAFNEIKEANERLLDPNARRIAAGMFHNTVRGIEKKKRKALKEGIVHTSVPLPTNSKLLASKVGAVGLGLPYTDEAMAIAVRAAFAEAENRRRTFEARVKRDNEDKVQEAKDELERQKEKAKEDRLWSLGREERKQGWQAFVGKRARGEEKEDAEEKEDGNNVKKVSIRSNESSS